MDWSAWLAIVIPSILGGLGILWVVGGYYHLRYYVLRRHEPEAWKCQPRRWLRPEQQREAMWLSSRNLVIGGLLSGTFIYALTHGHLDVPIYFDIDDYGLLYTLASTVLLFVLVDGLAYYAHRALHIKPLFRRVHHVHHRFVATSPWVVTAMHPVEFLTFQAVTFLPMFVLPLWYASAIAVFVYILVFNIIDHSGVKLVSRLPWQGPSVFHDDHHAHFHVNFGQCFTFWDRVNGTLRRKGRRYGIDVFGGKGNRGGPTEDGSDPDEFVRY